jgi:hypothetical protein
VTHLGGSRLFCKPSSYKEINLYCYDKLIADLLSCCSGILSSWSLEELGHAVRSSSPLAQVLRALLVFSPLCWLLRSLLLLPSHLLPRFSWPHFLLRPCSNLVDNGNARQFSRLTKPILFWNIGNINSWIGRIGSGRNRAFAFRT